MTLIANKPDHMQFEIEVKRRRITRLVHFTPFINLISIAEQRALLSVCELERINCQHLDLYLKDYIQSNDKLRLDGMRDYINLSIEHPNHYLFKRFRALHGNDWFEPWCVISIDPGVLWCDGTLFSRGNAASHAARAAGFGDNFEMFQSLFAENITAGNRNGTTILNRHNLAECHPTDVQAEVLVPQRIILSQILALSFENQQSLTMARGAFEVKNMEMNMEMNVNPVLFKERCRNG